MDSIKRRVAEKPREAEAPFQKKLSDPYTPYGEELFVSAEDSEQDDNEFAEKYEKKFQQGRLIKKIIFILIVIAAAVILSYAVFFFCKTYGTFKKISLVSESTTKPISLTSYTRTIISPIIPDEKQPLRGEQAERINILLLGAAGEKKPGGNLTDTIMVMSIDTKNKKVALLSLPRDFYARIPASTREDATSTRGGPDSESYAKINTLYPIGLKQDDGINLIKSAVSEILDEEINYYLVLDFEGFKKVINDIGGINITNERDIYDPRYPGPNYSYETFSLAKGFHTLDGETALKYVRERHNDPEGDFGRAKRQQQVIQAVKNKIFSAKTFLNVMTLNDLLTTLGNSVRTDISFEEIDDFINLSQEVDMQNITNVVVDAWKKDSLLKVSHVPTANAMMFILVPRVGNYSEIQDLSENIFDLNKIKKRQEAIAAEEAKVGIINQSGDSQLTYKIQSLIKDKLGIKDARIVYSPASNISEKTTALDNSSGAKLFTLDELIKKIPASLSTQAPEIADSSDYDIVITIGKDLIDVYKYEEDSMQDLQNAEDNQELMTND
ncbi:MAG TPA: LCP family protein [Candidatus Moranbacteria bacterium]|nr:LCP family protein [Candidatus Moranbacteria bacterium]HRY28150.1 LCP family protein [Candidatus Moranbacteria bacterium]HSA08465.1 LCP family protein [Candidatus Moranbacteria bacterium]